MIIKNIRSISNTENLTDSVNITPIKFEDDKELQEIKKRIIQRIEQEGEVVPKR